MKAKKQVQTAALFLTKAELAVATNTCERTISREIDKGTIKAIKIGSAVRIPKTELTRLLACIESA
ncbi:MAG TPA: helix-turn-helix domain-containing protein [Polyangiales bacterium]|nr:helix-turn-helix domain-containing protein [Polyangiales bacterium]